MTSRISQSHSNGPFSPSPPGKDRSSRHGVSSSVARTNAQNISSSRRALNPDEVRKRLRKEYEEKRNELKRVLKEAAEVLKERLHSMGVEDEDIERPAEGPGLGTSEVSNFHKGKIIHHNNVASTGYLMLLDSSPVQNTATRPASIYTGGSTPRGVTPSTTPRAHLPGMFRRALERHATAPHPRSPILTPRSFFKHAASGPRKSPLSAPVNVNPSNTDGVVMNIPIDFDLLVVDESVENYKEETLTPREKEEETESKCETMEPLALPVRDPPGDVKNSCLSCLYPYLNALLRVGTQGSSLSQRVTPALCALLAILESPESPPAVFPALSPPPPFVSIVHTSVNVESLVRPRVAMLSLISLRQALQTGDEAAKAMFAANIPPSLWTKVVSPGKHLDHEGPITVRIDGLRHVPPNVGFSRGFLCVRGGPFATCVCLQDPEACNVFPTFPDLSVEVKSPDSKVCVHVMFVAFDLKGTRKVIGHIIVRDLLKLRSEEVRLFYGADERSEQHVFPLTTVLLRVFQNEAESAPTKYDTTLCQPSPEEAKLYVSSMQRIPQKKSKELLTAKKVHQLVREQTVPEEWIETSYLGQYDPQYGFHIRIDSLAGITPSERGICKCVVEVSGWEGEKFVTRRHDWDAPQGYPSYPMDQFVTVAGNGVRFSSLMIVVVHVFACDNIRTHPEKWNRIGYACHQVFRPPAFVHNGTFAVPLYVGVPPRQLLIDMQSTPTAKVFSQWEARKTFPQRKMDGYYQGATKQAAMVVLSVCDARHRAGEQGTPMPRSHVPGLQLPESRGSFHSLRTILPASGTPELEEERLTAALETFIAKERGVLS